MERGFLEARSRLDSKFRRIHTADTEEGKKYRALKGTAAKRDFKLNWVKLDLQACKQKQVKSQRKTLSQADTVRGTMVTFGGLVERYGGWSWAPAVTGAKRTAAKCVKLGGKWSAVDDFSELMLFRLVEKSDTEEFTRSWEELKKETVTTRKDIEANDTPAPAAPPPAQLPPEEPQDGQRKRPREDDPQPDPSANKNAGKPNGRDGKRTKDKGNKNPDDKPVDPTAAAFKDLMNEAQRFKGVYMKAVYAADLLVAQIRTADTHVWARGSELTELEGFLKAARDGISEVLTEFLVLDAQGMKDNYDQATLSDELKTFLLRKTSVDRLELKMKQIKAMHNVKLKMR